LTVQSLFSGVRVLDLAGESAVFTGRLLADLGAEVVRVEPPRGDAVRRRRPFLDGREDLEKSLYHLHFNRNKLSVALDLARADDRARFLRLAQTADVVLETAPPGVMDALGIGYETLQATNPGLVYTSVTPFGQSGPFRDYRGNDLTAAAASGLLYLNGFPDDAPAVPGAEQAFKMASLVAACGAGMALVGRQGDPGRRGRRVDVSVQEAASMATLQTANANIYTWHGRIPRRFGNASGIHQCKDGKWISFVLRTGVQETWGDMVEWLQDERIDSPVTGEAWLDQAFRIENRRAVTEAISRLCAKHERSIIFHEGQRRKQLVMSVNDGADLMEDEQLRERSFFVSVPHSELGRTLTDSGSPYRFSSAAALPQRRAALLGEHNDQILGTLPATAPPAPRPVAAAPPLRAAKPLAGVRVADFSWMIAGPAASRVLADFGAEVIKIESQYRVDNIRAVGVQPAGGGSLDTNGVFNDCNTNKLSLRLNVNHPRGLELVKEIIKRSDIVLNNYTADRMPRWGLGYEDLKALKADIIMLSMPVMGSTGPYRNYGSYGNGIVAYGGLNMTMGLPERPPVGLGPLYSDFAGPYLVVFALMAALHHRNHTGVGQFIDFSQVEAMVSLLGPAVLEYTANRGLPERMGNRSLDFAPHGVFPCFGDDRWCAIAIATDGEWRLLCAEIGRPDLAEDPRYATLAARKANEEELEKVISAWTRDRDPWQVMHQLQGRGLMAAVVEDLEDMVVRDPWLSAQHLVPLAAGEDGLVFRTHAQPVRMNGETPSLRAAPRFGEHSEQVLRDLLGLDGAAIQQLLIDEVVY